MIVLILKFLFLLLCFFFLCCVLCDYLVRFFYGAANLIYYLVIKVRIEETIIETNVEAIYDNTLCKFRDIRSIYVRAKILLIDPRVISSVRACRPPNDYQCSGHIELSMSKLIQKNGDTVK